MKRIIYLILTVLLFIPITTYAEEITEDNIKVETVTLDECIDINKAKFKLDEEDVIKIRLLAVDNYSDISDSLKKEASSYTCTLLTDSKEIKLEYDTNSLEEDVYGYKLAWVFVDDVLLQDTLVSKGYVEVDDLDNEYKYTSLLKTSEEISKTAMLGIWNNDVSVEEAGSILEENDTTKKGFFSNLIDNLLASICNFVNELLEKLLKLIEDML